ncbi:plasmid replication protein, CyRepA1 family [Gloeocapsa sp. PCC 73106]|uniref:plasmid replication protein, CyRepA1 family n=1 Tax=Gloeocapsa sp. PCC 73106 TaxID=102232 RepID=UPI0002ABBDE6|nr:plasmid replication protein, CyRepA1 family [Gloeocapsa sp. PCC 73106]ELR97398.1 hypothetical protein GLO73106DRAFT_00012080 [Gloeocapsa sp. PCC 73106]
MIASQNQLKPHHREELIASGIAPELIESAFYSLEGDEAIARLLCSEKLVRTNTGRVSSRYLRSLSHLKHGAWFVRCVNPITGEERDFTTCKPDQPRMDFGKQKPIKYENPPKTSTEPIFLNVPPSFIERTIEAAQDLCYEGTNLEIAKDHNLTYWEFVILAKIPIVIVEGAKKAAALISMGIPAVAVTGIFNNIPNPKKKELIVDKCPQLEPFLIEMERNEPLNRQVIIAFDQDEKIKTIKSVNQAIDYWTWGLRKLKAIPYVATWDKELGKGIDDVAYTHGSEKVKQIFREALPSTVWKAGLSSKLLRIPDYECNERYLNLPISRAYEHRLLVIKSGTDTGKTTFLEKAIANNKQKGILSFVVVSRNSLGRNMANRFSLPHRNTETTKEDIYGSGGLVLCVDSLHEGYIPIQELLEEKTPYMLIFDECNETFAHSVTSTTDIKKRRGEILTNIALLAQNAVSNILLSADVSDRDIDLYEAISNLNPFVIVNHYKSNTGKKWIDWDDPYQMVIQTQNSIAEGKNVLILCDTVKRSSKKAFTTISLEEQIAKTAGEKGLDLKRIRIDTETVGKVLERSIDSKPLKHPAYELLDDINNISQYQIAIASPIISSGVDINVDHFDEIYYFGNGVQDAEKVLQQIARVRDPKNKCTVNVYLPKLSLAKNYAVTPAQVAYYEHQKFKVNLNYLHQQGLTYLPPEKHPQDILKAWEIYYAEVVADNNLKGWCYAEYIQHSADARGYQRISWREQDLDYSVEEIEATKEEIQEIKKEINRDWVNNRLNAVDIGDATKNELEELEKTTGLTDEENWELQKRKVKDLWVGDNAKVTENIINLYDHNLYQSLKTLFMAAFTPDFVPSKHSDKLEYYLREHPSFIKHDFNSINPNRMLIELLQRSGLLSLFGLDKSSITLNLPQDETHVEYWQEVNRYKQAKLAEIKAYVEDEALIDRSAFEKAITKGGAQGAIALLPQQIKSYFKQYFNLNLDTNQEPFKIACKVLRRFGIKPKQVKRGEIKEDGTRQREYILDKVPELESIFTHWLQELLPKRWISPEEKLSLLVADKIALPDGSWGVVENIGDCSVICRNPEGIMFTIPMAKAKESPPTVVKVGEIVEYRYRVEKIYFQSQIVTDRWGRSKSIHIELLEVADIQTLQIYSVPVNSFHQWLKSSQVESPGEKIPA